MLQVKKKIQVSEDSSRVASLCRMLRHRTKQTITPNKIVSIRNATAIQQVNRPQSNGSCNKENQELNRNHRRSSTHLEKPEGRSHTRNSDNGNTPLAVQKNNCKVHPNRKGLYELQDGLPSELYCDRCAIRFTNQGHRLFLNNEQTKVRRCLEECMKVQLCVVQRAYRELISRLESELAKLETKIRNSYETELNKEQLEKKMGVLFFKPQHLNSQSLTKINNLIGRLETKTLTSSELTARKDESHRDSESQLSLTEAVRPFSCRSKHLPTEILIELSGDESHLQFAPPPPNKHIRNESITLHHEIENFLKQ